VGGLPENVILKIGLGTMYLLSEMMISENDNLPLRKIKLFASQIYKDQSSRSVLLVYASGKHLLSYRTKNEGSGGKSRVNGDCDMMVKYKSCDLRHSRKSTANVERRKARRSCGYYLFLLGEISIDEGSRRKRIGTPVPAKNPWIGKELR
jgi:hypothetical protein